MLWKIKASCERINNGTYEMQLFIGYARTELECFEWLVRLKDQGKYFVKDIHVERIH